MLTKPKTIVKTSLLSIVVLVLGAFYPVAVLAEDGGATDTNTSTPTTTTTPTTNTAPAPITSTPTTNNQTGPTKPTGPNKPTGADASTYHYNEATGLWENDHYTWNPKTNQTTPKTTPSYSYNPDTGMWDTTKWIFNPTTGTYVPNKVSVAEKPAGAPIAVNSANPQANGLAVENSSAPNSQNSNGEFIDSNGVKHSSKDSHVFDSFYNASISNNINSQSHSGDVDLSRNTLAGNAMSGMASATVNIMNLLQSSWGALGSGNFVSFVSNILGNVVGDLFLNPGAANPTGTASSPSDIDVNVQNNGQINNNINVDATSGNVNANSNTIVGDATTGDANAVANVVNMINSLVSSGQSFVGTINVEGNLNGDILMPPDWLNSLLGSNAPTANLSNNNIDSSSLTADLNDNQTINNNVNLAANSGSANVNQNTTAGNIQTGNANTNLTVLNLTGRQVIGSNALLVFVNVLGNWVGAIVNAPAGSTAAALGSGITSNKTLQGQDTDIHADSNSLINNNLNLNATSGDANVTQNTQAGNTRTGDATASANLANLTNSSFAFSNWFGVLFINVFGTWNGSFGIDTAAGNKPVSATLNPAALAASNKVKVFRFAPTNSGKFKPIPVTTTPSNVDSNDSHTNAVLASTSTNNHSANGSQSHVAAAKSWFIPTVGSLIGASLLGTERVLTMRDRRRAIAPKRVAYHLS